MKQMVISLGEVLWDLFPDGEQFGGAPANFACHAAIAGAHVAMISAVGSDRHGREALDILRRHGIDVSLMQTVADAPTGTVGITLDPAGKPTFTIHEGSAWDRMVWNDQLDLHIRKAAAVYFGTLGQRAEASRSLIRRCLQLARDVGIPRILDINLRAPFFDATMIRESIALASILKLSDDELPAVCDSFGVGMDEAPETALRQLLDSQSLELVVMTRGEKGALLLAPDDVVDQPGIHTTVKDTVGAGDAFTATFLLGLLQGQPHADNLLTACTVAAKTCSHMGAVPSPKPCET